MSLLRSGIIKQYKPTPRATPGINEMIHNFKVKQLKLLVFSFEHENSLKIQACTAYDPYCDLTHPRGHELMNSPMVTMPTV